MTLGWSKIAEKYISQRSVGAVKPYWGELEPRTGGEPALGDLLRETLSVEDLDFSESQLIAQPGAIWSGWIERDRIAAKALRATNASYLLFDAGSAGWASVDAYHATLLYARTILACYGIFICNIDGKNVVVDVFPQLGTGKYLKKYQREAQGLDNPIRIMSKSGHPIQHKDVLAIVSRVARISGSKDMTEMERNIVGRFANLGYRSVRNRILYEGSFWPEDIGDLYCDVKHDYTKNVGSLVSDIGNKTWTDSEFCDHILCGVMKGIGERIQE